MLILLEVARGPLVLAKGLKCYIYIHAQMYLSLNFANVGLLKDHVDFISVYECDFVNVVNIENMKFKWNNVCRPGTILVGFLNFADYILALILFTAGFFLLFGKSRSLYEGSIAKGLLCTNIEFLRFVYRPF